MPHKSILLFQLHFQLCQKLKILKNQSLVLFFGVLKDKSHCPKLHANQFLKKSVMKEKNQLYFPCSQDEQQIFSPVTGNVTLLECSSLQTMRYNSLSINGFCCRSQRHLGLRVVTYSWRKKIQKIFSFIYTLLKIYFASISRMLLT